jgi:hypothetical protein
MRRRSLVLALPAAMWVCSTAHALTQEEIRAKLEAAGYSRVREMPSGKIKTFKAVRDGKERSIVVDTNGHIKELE